MDPGLATGYSDTATLSEAPTPDGSAPELKRIQFVGQNSVGNGLVRIAAAVTNEELRQWLIKGNKWALPASTIVVEGTVIGTLSTICHGAGRRHKTLSDLVRQVEYVDCNGNLQVINDPYQLKAAAGSFGLLGVITHIIYELIPMTYAVMKPQKLDVRLAVPPVTMEDIPASLRRDWLDHPSTSQHLAAAQAEFERRASDDFYSEWL